MTVSIIFGLAIIAEYEMTIVVKMAYIKENNHYLKYCTMLVNKKLHTVSIIQPFRN